MADKSSLHTDLSGQTAVVTGASSGLGKAIAQKLADCGARVFNLDVRPPENPTDFIQTDLMSESEVRRSIELVLAKTGRIDMLVNSAGITGQTGIKSHETDPGDVLKVFQLNFFGSYHTSLHVLPAMLRQHYGRILHIASIAGKEGNAGMLAYSASKAAVIGMAKVQGKEYAETGITVNALAPAVVQTALVEAMPEAQVKYMTDKIPMKRCGTLEEVADLALYILSPSNSFTTGFTFDLTGGRATY